MQELTPIAAAELVQEGIADLLPAGTSIRAPDPIKTVESHLSWVLRKLQLSGTSSPGGQPNAGSPDAARRLRPHHSPYPR